ncbi:hypothetical protein [Dechloromonas hortensis]|uniref:hypothetical protein n=1 Tax=Dechloromonas hortensis TaxID=337779 RepID=UPI0012923C1A|nr:hypothetical protein [Dechloromonas hortensis]
MSKLQNKRENGDDRRGVDLGPPSGWRERRRSVERRLPDVKEIPFSEWLTHIPGHLVKEVEKV